MSCCVSAKPKVRLHTSTLLQCTMCCTAGKGPLNGVYLTGFVDFEETIDKQCRLGLKLSTTHLHLVISTCFIYIIVIDFNSHVLV